MNKTLAALTGILTIAVVILFMKVYASDKPSQVEGKEEMPKEESIEKKDELPPMPSSQPTGKIVYVDIDQLNERSSEVEDLVRDAKRKKDAIEASMEKLQNDYQRKIQDYQTAAKAGIAPPSELQATEREIMRLEKDANEKQLQMDNLSLEINDKNAQFQKNVRAFLQKWNNGRYDYVLSYSEVVPSMLIGNSALDVTNEVIEALNNEYKARKGRK
jgi:outer membrane protein